MLEISHTTQFKKDYKLIIKRKKDQTKLQKLLELLSEQKIIPSPIFN